MIRATIGKTTLLRGLNTAKCILRPRKRAHHPLNRNGALHSCAENRQQKKIVRQFLFDMQHNYNRDNAGARCVNHHILLRGCVTTLRVYSEQITKFPRQRTNTSPRTPLVEALNANW